MIIDIPEAADEMQALPESAAMVPDWSTLTQSSMGTPILLDITEKSPEPSTSSYLLQSFLPERPFAMTIKKLGPMPHKNKRAEVRKSKSEKSEVLISTPYKEALDEKEDVNIQKEHVKEMRKEKREQAKKLNFSQRGGTAIQGKPKHAIKSGGMLNLWSQS
ncbi:hypothetical protein ILUMI_07970 [Ignelater luminosus]|uniref:Uncharacterized protein n=1 Tax=Ignelater luminosus TaxID=2038154 RepID=A0A8K0D2H7_IGNLU|nr:hypothetical protein ILUMI_07970 [Ignelater luminosus]